MTKQETMTLVDHLGQLGFLKPHKVNGNWYTIRCPFHGDGNEKRPSCGILLQDEYRNGQLYKAGMFHCFACGYAKSMYDAVQDILKRYNISEEGRAWANENILPDSSIKDTSETLLPPTMISAITDKFAVENMKLRLHKQSYISEEELSRYRFTVPYMYDRRLTDDVIARYDVGFDANYIPDGWKHTVPCITFPVRDLRGNTLFFCRRSIEGKFFFMPKDIEKPVYGIYELPQGAKSVIICESCFNALTAVVYGYYAVALFGTGTPYQIQQLCRLGVREFVICLDPDNSGSKGTARLRKGLSRNAIIRELKMPQDKDLNDCSKEEFDKIYRGEDDNAT